jgi:hypothetical protein
MWLRFHRQVRCSARYVKCALLHGRMNAATRHGEPLPAKRNRDRPIGEPAAGITGST